jgi:hypothetical protein
VVGRPATPVNLVHDFEDASHIGLRVLERCEPRLKFVIDTLDGGAEIVRDRSELDKQHTLQMSGSLVELTPLAKRLFQSNRWMADHPRSCDIPRMPHDHKRWNLPFRRSFDLRCRMEMVRE